MFNNNELFNISNNELRPKNIKILDVEKVNDFLFIVLENNQKILTNGRELYDVSDYDHLSNLFNMDNKFCAVLMKGYTPYLVDLKTMEVLFEDNAASFISKQDDRTLHVVMRINRGNDNIYDIKTKKYISSDENYEFENSLGNHLYVFSEKSKSHSDFYDDKRCIINADGKVILKDIEGWIELYDNYLIIKKTKELCIVKINEDSSLDMNTIKQDDKIIAKPEYYDGNIIIIEKGLIKILKLDLSLINQFEIEDLESVIDYEFVSDILKICLPYTINGERVGKHLFINLKTGKSISHLRIEGYPYWTPEVYVGKDDLNDEQRSFIYGKTYEQTEYHFYDSKFNKLFDVKGNYYSDIDDSIFVVDIFDGKDIKRKFINGKTGVIKECDYDSINFLPDKPDGYAFNTITDMIDIVDKDLNVIIPNIDYKQFGLHKFASNFGYFVVNNYICINIHVDDVDHPFYRYIIQNDKGEIILDSKEHKCYPMGNFIQIIKNGESEFLNTLTGEISQLSITASTDEKGKIDFNIVNDLKNIFKIESVTQLLLSQSDLQTSKVKKFVPNIRKYD